MDDNETIQEQQQQAPSQRRRSRRNWKIDSEQYRNFAAICKNRGWQNLNHLPTFASDEAVASGLFDLMRAGLGDDSPFSRAQMTSKFAHWKKTLNNEEAIVQPLDESQVTAADDILRQAQKTDFFLIIATDTIGDTNTTFETVVNSVHGRSALAEFRKRCICSMNNALAEYGTSIGKGSRMYEAETTKIDQWFANEGFFDATKCCIGIDSSSLSDFDADQVKFLGSLLMSLSNCFILP